MKAIHYCPCCGRYIGESIGSDESCQCKVLTVEPKKLKKKQLIMKSTCKKCKTTLYVSLEFID